MLQCVVAKVGIHIQMPISRTYLNKHKKFSVSRQNEQPYPSISSKIHSQRFEGGSARISRKIEHEMYSRSKIPNNQRDYAKHR